MNDQTIACNVQAIKIDERQRHFDLVNQWQKSVDKVEELPAGYAFRFAPGTVKLMELAEFVGRERLCCHFFHFEIVVEANDGPHWLRLLGGEAVKAFIRESLPVG